ncbi:MAG: hypothetical protein HEP71_26260 [Roseivirga sp.]|nr:hypothetical protein [Roseivirga sp.]
MRRLRLTFILLSAVAITQVYGQEGEGTLEGDPEIIIDKTRKITLPAANRNFEKIPQLPVNPAATDQRYSFKSYNYTLSPLQPTFRAVRLPIQDAQTAITGNYIKAGYGNFSTPYLEVYFSSLRNENYVFNLYGRHLSSKKGPVFDDNSGSADTEIGLGGKYFNGNNTISGSLDYLSRKRHFYGYNPALDLTPGDIEQKFTGFSAKIGVTKTNKDEASDYHFLTDWGFFKDAFNARESQFNFDVGFSFKPNDNLEVKLQGLATFSSREDTEKVNRSFVNLKPRLLYYGTSFKLSAGANFATDNDDLSTFAGAEDGFKVFPHIRIDLNPSKGLNFYAGYEGDLEMNTFRSFADINPFLEADFALFNTEKESDIFGGLNIDLAEGVRLKAGVSIASLQRLPFFTNAITDSTRFEVLYDTDAIDRTNIFSELVYENPGSFRSSLRFDFYDYKLVTLTDAFHRPQYQALLNATTFPVEGLTVSGDLYYVGGLVGLNRESAIRTELDDIIDLNLEGKYDLNEQLGVFLQIRNIFGKEYQRYLNYPNRGIQFLAGIAVSF